MCSSDLSEIRPHAWSPDGRQIAVQRRTTDDQAQIGFVNTQGGALRVLKSWRGRLSNRLASAPDAGRSKPAGCPAFERSDARAPGARRGTAPASARARPGILFARQRRPGEEVPPHPLRRKKAEEAVAPGARTRFVWCRRWESKGQMNHDSALDGSRPQA